MGFNVLIADDKGSDIDKAKNIVSKSIIGSYIDNIYTCQFIKTKYNCPPTERTFLELIPDIKNLDFAIVDLSWDDDKDFSNYSEGGKFIMNEIINKKYFHCLIMPLTKEIGENISPEDQIFRLKTLSEEIVLESISKKADASSQIDRLNDIYLTKWLLPFLSKISSKEALQIISQSIHKESLNETFALNSRTWEVNKLIYNAEKILPNIKRLVKNGLGFTHPRDIYNWSNQNRNKGGAIPKHGVKSNKPKSLDLVYIYKLYIDFDKKNGLKKTKEINSISDKLVKAYFDSQDQHRMLEKINVSEVNIYNNNLELLFSTESDDLVKYYNLLIWRRVILALNKLIETALTKYDIYELYSTANPQPKTIDKFFYKLGFKITGKYLFPGCFVSDNCFPEENSWLKTISIN